MSLKRKNIKISNHLARNFPEGFFQNRQSSSSKNILVEKSSISSKNLKIKESLGVSKQTSKFICKGIQEKALKNVPMIMSKNIHVIRGANMDIPSSPQTEPRTTIGYQQDRCNSDLPGQDILYNTRQDMVEPRNTHRNQGSLIQKGRHRRESGERVLCEQFNTLNNEHFGNKKISYLTKMDKSHSNPVDKRRGKMQENAKLLLALKTGNPSLNHLKLAKNESGNPFMNHKNLTARKDDGRILPALKIRSRSETKKRHNSESPSRNPNAHSAVNHKDHRMGSLKVNFLAKNTHGANQDMSLVNRAYMKKQRSNTENRMRHLQRRHISFKTTNGQKDLFKDIDFVKSHSEKKPRSGFQPLRKDVKRAKSLFRDILQIKDHQSEQAPSGGNNPFQTGQNQISPTVNSEKLCPSSREISTYDDEVDSKYN